MCERRDKSTRKQHSHLSFSLSIKFKAKKKKTICHLQCSSGAKIQLELWKLTRSNPECLRDLNAP